tara:strand:+ start:484 stop:1695 length:1212 start_codon:yes stop_codon:yes gene_type:complete
MKICIIGGGTAGWMAAAHIEKEIPESTITLIESPTIPIIGVGESSLPQLRNFFNELGIDDDTWVSECNGLIKNGNEKVSWNGDDDRFKFTFWYDANGLDDWLDDYQKYNLPKESLNDKFYNDKGWQGYAYHLDAELIPTLLKKYTERTTHIIDTIEVLPKGYDLYLDCTGFKRKFVRDRKFIDLTSRGHIVNKAWVQSFKLNDKPYNYTESVALDHGWQFNIDTREKRGCGYVFASQFCTTEQALEYFQEYNSDYKPYQESEPRLLEWTSGFLDNPWQDNIVALGLTSGFIEPLESNALYMIQYSITNLVKIIKRNYNPQSYNKVMKKLWLHNSDFLLHLYKLSPRNDTDFWRYYQKDNTDLTLWQNYIKHNNKWISLYPSSMWANVAVLYDEFSKKSQHTTV